MQILFPQADQDIADASLRALAFEGQLRRGQIVHLEPPEQFGNNPPGIQALLHHVRDRLNLFQVSLQFVNDFIARIWQRLDDKSTSANAL